MIAISVLLKVSVLLASAAGIHAIFHRHMSAGGRHLLWTLLVIALLLLPAVSLLPAWTVAVTPRISMPRPAPDGPRSDAAEFDTIGTTKSASSAPMKQSRTAISRDVNWLTAFGIVYVTGMVLLVIRFALDQI